MPRRSPLIVAASLTMALACFAPPAIAVVLADTQADFSVVAQGTNGFQYGVYTGANAVSENVGAGILFSTANFTVINGNTWYGGEGLGTPALTNIVNHPGLSLNPAVRRYTVGANGEPAYVGLARIAGQFSDLDGGATDGFITVNGFNMFNQPVPNTGDATGFVNFDFTVPVVPGTTIDFGVSAGANAFSDSTRIVGTIETVPEPTSAGVVAVALAFAATFVRRGVRRI